MEWRRAAMNFVASLGVLLLAISMSDADEITPFPKTCNWFGERIIQCSNTSLEDLNYKFQSSIKVFSLVNGHQKILHNHTFTYLNLTDVEIIGLDCNIIEEIETAAFKDVKGLRILELNNNKLTNLPLNVFPSNIKVLFLSNNPIIIPSNRPFLNISMLKTLDLNNCNISNIPTDMFQLLPSIKVLRFINNNISIISANTFKFLPRLRHIDLSNNHIRTLDPNMFQNNPDLEYLALNENELSIPADTDFFNIRTLKTLQLSFCNISFIEKNDFKNIPNLETLHLSNNVLSNIREDTFQFLSKLTTIDLSHNKIKILPRNVFNKNPKVDFLYLDENPLNLSVPFLSSPTLRWLNMNNCNISAIHLDTFRSLPMLRFVNLRDNMLEDLDDMILNDLQHLTSLSLLGNPLACKCRKNELNYWADRMRIHFDAICLGDDLSNNGNCKNNTEY